MTVTTDRALYTPPWGVFGGKSGRPSVTKIYRADGREESWRKVSNLPLKDSDLVSFQTGGGGGYGSPLERDPEMVLWDAINGYISLHSAREHYGVVIREPRAEGPLWVGPLLGEEMTLDLEATRRLRDEMRASQAR
jgi:N-methylhydantoinase B